MAVVRISKGSFEPEKYDEVSRLIDRSAVPLIPALQKLHGLIYYHAGVDRLTSTVTNVSVWVDLDAAKQMDSLAEMIAQRPILEGAGVRFDRIANYVPTWTLGAVYGQRDADGGV